ncbi:MAG: hypothetical protein U1F35_09545 [Steroidobacteraceae bacterium]
MSAAAAPRGLKLGSTLYSFINPYHSRELSFEQLIAKVAELGIGPGLEIIGFQSIRGFPQVSDEFADRFKELMDRHRLIPSALSINADAAIRRGRLMSTEEAVAYLEPQIRAAAKLGFPVVRSQFSAPAEVMERLVPLVEKLEIKIGPEIHAPLGVNSVPVMKYRELYARLRSPFLGFVPDFGSSANSLPASYLQMLRSRHVPEGLLSLALSIWTGPGEPQWKREEFNRRASEAKADASAASSLSVMFSMLSPQKPEAWLEIMPQVVHVHGKFYDLDASGHETSIPYEQLLPVFIKGGYDGFMSSEWEGHIYSRDSGFEAVQQHHALCRRIIRDVNAGATMN